MAQGTSMPALVLRDFSGGLNLRDAPSEVADNESPDLLNVTLDERGGVVKRLGRTKYNSSQLNSTAFQNLFYWQTGQLMFTQQGTSIYNTNGGGTWSAAVKTFSTSARVAFCDFQGKVVVVHPVDGVFTSTDGTTFTQTAGGTNNMEAVRGNCIAVWQNKVWVAGDPNNPPRVWASNAGDPTKYTIATDFVDVREKDNALVTALGAGHGEDVQAHAGLLVFKEESCYRINSANATTGFTFTTLDTQYGAAGPLAVVSNLGLICAISKKGIIVTNGVDPPQVASRKIEPLFRPEQLDFSTSSNWSAGVYRDRIVFSLNRRIGGASQSTPNFTLEYHPAVGWISCHDFGSPAFATWAKNDSKLYSCSPTNGYAYETFKGGTDDGAAIACRFQTRWFEPGKGILVRFRRLLVSGRGTFNLYTKFDYSTAQGDLIQVAILGSGMTWGTGVWGTGLYGVPPIEDYEQYFSLGIGRAISFGLTESSSTSASTVKLLADGSAIEVGNWALYGLEIEHVVLANA